MNGRKNGWLAGDLNFHNLPKEITFSSTSHSVLNPITNSLLISAAQTHTKAVQRGLQPFSRHAFSFI